MPKRRPTYNPALRCYSLTVAGKAAGSARAGESGMMKACKRTRQQIKATSVLEGT